MENPSTRQLQAAQETEQAHLVGAHQAFMAGDYEKARALFASAQHAQNAEMARQALYGLACTQLVAAQTPQEYRQGVKLWESWAEFCEMNTKGEDPRLLAPLLPRMAPRPQPAIAPPPVDVEAIKAEAEKEIDAQRQTNKTLQAQVAELEKEVQILSYFEEYSRNLEIEIQTLRHQIQTLQAIDQNIQQKKQEISNQ